MLRGLPGPELAPRAKTQSPFPQFSGRTRGFAPRSILQTSSRTHTGRLSAPMLLRRVCKTHCPLRSERASLRPTTYIVTTHRTQDSCARTQRAEHTHNRSALRLRERWRSQAQAQEGEELRPLKHSQFTLCAWNGTLPAPSRPSPQPPATSRTQVIFNERLQAQEENPVVCVPKPDEWYT